MALEILERQATPIATLTIRTHATPKDIGPTYRELLNRVFAFMEGKGIGPSGPPFGIYHTFTDRDVDMEVGFPVSSPTEGEGEITGGELPGGREAVAVHEGGYGSIGETHRALEAYVSERGGPGGPPREVYLVGPADTEDSSSWRTEVVYPMT